ncbi:MAG: hypothetical protein KDK25_14965, partial [Leptospiraceae bacterium]|nr:hypothetical protein [Leptospiraceae bacterium]
METSNIEIWNRHYLKPESKQSYPDEALVRMVRSLPAAGEYRQPSGQKAGPDSMDPGDTRVSEGSQKTSGSAQPTM